MIKTIFFSTSDRMVPLLNKLNDLTDLKLCITKKDVKVGRKLETKENAVEKWCTENNKEYIQIDTLKDETLDKVITQVQKINPDLGIVVDFGIIIPNKLIELFEKPLNGDKKLVNIHYSLLPKYRGASPIQFAILNGETQTGVTYQLVHQKMDMGNILLQEKHSLKGDETAQSLFEQLLCLNIESLSKFINLYEHNELKEVVQNESEASYTYSPTQHPRTLMFKEDAYTEFKEPSNVLERKVRAFYPWPVLWSYLKHLAEYKGLKLKNKSKGDLTVKIYEGSANNGQLDIAALQVEGKTKVTWEEFTNGYLT